MAVDDDVRERVPDQPLPDLSRIRTVAVRTGSEAGGFHRYFRYEGVFGKIIVGPGMQIRGEGHYTVLPPSVHPSGRAYEFLPSQGFDDVDVVPLPKDLIALARQYAQNETGTTKGAPIPPVLIPGERHDWLMSLAGTMRKRGASGEAILAALVAENRVKCKPPIPEEELPRMARNAERGIEPALSLKEELRRKNLLKKTLGGVEGTPEPPAAVLGHPDAPLGPSGEGVE